MNECNVGEEAELNGEVPGNVGTIKVDARDYVDERVIESGGTKDSSIVAYIWSNPIACSVVWVGMHGMFPRLEGYVGSTEARICYVDVDLDVELEVDFEVGEGGGDGRYNAGEEEEELEAAQGRHHAGKPWRGLGGMEEEEEGKGRGGNSGEW